MQKTGYARFFLIICIVMGIIVVLSVTRPRNTQQASQTKDLDEIMAIDLDQNYPETPDEVLMVYNKIEKLLSGNLPNGYTDEDLNMLIEKQRKLLDSELLAINPLDAQMQGVREKLDYVAQENMRIIQIIQETPRFTDNATRCSINSNQYWSLKNKYNGTSYSIYHLLKEEDYAETEGKWHIVGWEVTDIQGIEPPGKSHNEEGQTNE